MIVITAEESQAPHLPIGSIGIMNSIPDTGTERTGVVGLRKSIGTKR